MKHKSILIIVVVAAVALVLMVLFSGECSNKKTDWSHKLYNTRTAPYGTYIIFDLLKDVFPDRKIESTRLLLAENIENYVIRIKRGEVYNLGDDPVYTDEEDSDDYSDYSDEYFSESEDSDEELNLKEDISDTIGIATDTMDVAEDATYLPKMIEDSVLQQYANTNISDTTTYVFIDKSLSLDGEDGLGSGDGREDLLLDFVGVGNNVFIASEYFDRKLIDALAIEAHTSRVDDDTTATVQLTDYTGKIYEFRKLGNTTYFQILDLAVDRVRVLGVNANGQPVFIQLKYGKGYFFLHAIPTAFTNVEILKKEKYDFAFRSLSYIPATNNILWDEFLKQGYEYPRDNSNGGGIFRVIFANESLTIAFWLILIGFLLFMIFRAKRIQRIVPIIESPVNSSVEFMDTISNLYYKKKDYRAVVVKRHAYFLDYIRKNYFMPTEIVDEDFIRGLSAKTTIEESKLKRIFNYHTQIIKADRITNIVFMQYNNLLEDIYRTILNK